MTADALLQVPEPGNLRAAIASLDWTLSRAESAIRVDGQDCHGDLA